tara:strand:+ start:8627 stop:10681 length:2055 start_codon:yes stop_codon:yes gene_type:complete
MLNEFFQNRITSNKWLVGLGSHGLWPFIALILILTIVLPPLDFTADSVPNGDHASNSMLVLQAKHFGLFHGNYSRVGFYHPGPYFLYVMAAGEWLFYDLLGIVTSPEAAHRIAIAISNLALLGIVFGIVRRYLENQALAACVALLGLGVVLSRIPLLNSVWPPHMYIVPALLFTVAIWDIMRGEARSLWVAALAGGIMIHGHASNLGLVPLMFLGTIAGGLVLRKTNHEAITPTAIWAWIRPHVPAAAIVFAIFVTPYLLQTLTHWPGETLKYFQQSGKADNTLVESLNYSVDYWGHRMWIIAAALFVFALAQTGTRQAAPAGPEPKPARRDVLAFGAVFVITSSAMVFYGIKGVDNLSHNYIGLWYLGAIGGLALIMSAIALRYAGPWLKRSAALALLIAASALLIVFRYPFPPPWHLNQDAPSARAALEAIYADAGASDVVIDLDHAPEAWTYVWRFSLALFETNARDKMGSICVPARNWNISFHDDIRCTSDAVVKAMSTGKVYFISNRDLDKRIFTLITTFGDLNVYREDDLAQIFSGYEPSSKNAHFENGLLFGDGWGRVEPHRVWQRQTEAKLNLFVSASSTPRTAKLVIAAFIPVDSVTQNVEISSNGSLIDSFVLSDAYRTRVVSVPLPASANSQIVPITVKVDELRAPSDWIDSGDKRRLGVNLRKISIVAEPSP